MKPARISSVSEDWLVQSLEIRVLLITDCVDDFLTSFSPSRSLKVTPYINSALITCTSIHASADHIFRVKSVKILAE